MLILTWLNFARSAWVFQTGDRFGTLLFTKIVVVVWFGLVAILQTAYYCASHTGQLIHVLLTLPVTRDRHGDVITRPTQPPRPPGNLGAVGRLNRKSNHAQRVDVLPVRQRRRRRRNRKCF